ncbi:MAG: SH3 domain-containing protein [Clostridia bacterium]|nr:SH3 domain-containing protein [Clostridia bacterium]
MMKRIMACLLAAVCLLTSFAFAEGLYMKVVNVNTAVNLRKGPSTDTEALGQVPVGTVVTDCVKEGKWYQVNYNGTVGYIRGDKLQEVEAPAEAVSEQPAEQPAEAVAEASAAEPAEEPAAEPAPEATKKPKSKKKKKAKATEAPAEEAAVAEGEPLVAEGEPLQPEATRSPRRVVQTNVENAPVNSYADVSEYIDDAVILDQVVGDVRVIGRQIYQQDCEYLMAVGLDASGNELWKTETTTDNITELMQTDVFIGGTAEEPLVMMYNACRGLSAIDPADGKVKWTIYKRDLNLGGSISHVVDAKGVCYIGGYYGPDPVAINPEGEVLWQASSGNVEATWLYRMDLSDEGIACAYGKMAGDNYGTIIYDFDGNVVSIVNE